MTPRLAVGPLLLLLALMALESAVNAQQPPTEAQRPASATQQPAAPTQVRLFAPFNPGGLAVGLAVTDEVSGNCFAGSVASPERPDAWRCSAGNAILDPCFQDVTGGSGTLACAEEPFSADVVVLTLTEELPQPTATGEPDFAAALPWAVELENGRRCVVLTGATAPLAGMRINYGCDDGSRVAGPVDRTAPLWRVFFQAEDGGLSLDQVGVTTAWY